MNALIEIPHGVKLLVESNDAVDFIRNIQRATFVRTEGYGKHEKMIEVQEEVEIRLVPFTKRIHEENDAEVIAAKLKEAQDGKDTFIRLYNEKDKELQELKEKLINQATSPTEI